MYEAFYGLREKPFNMTPDPKYFYASAKHNDALSSLLYTIQERRGFAVVTGEIGSGKTTVCRTLLSKLGRDTRVAIIRNTQINPKDLIQMTLEDLEAPVTTGTKVKLLSHLNDFLIEQLSQDANVVLLIDEAQNLTPSVLEEVRMLSNLETDREKLIQILLVGQPELWQTLNLSRLAQFKQRIAVHYHLTPLDPDEVRGYVSHRLRLAGANGRAIFTDEACHRVHQHSRGVPRLVNALADRSLLVGYVEESAHVTPALVDEAAKDIPAIATPTVSDSTGIPAPDDAASWALPSGLHRKLSTARQRQRSQIAHE